MMWRTVIVLGCFVGAVFTSPVGLKDIPMTDDALLHQKTEMAMSTLNLPSNATSIRADITDGFNCDGRLYGYYADIDNDCQIFHVCLPVTYPDGKENTFRWSFICPEETIFSQESFTCVRSLDLGFDCTESVRFYDLNRNFGIAGDIDTDMNDFLRKTPTEMANAIPLEPKPAIPATTATPVFNRRRPGEPNLRRQPTKAAATTQASVVRAQPTRIITTAAIPTPTAAPTPAEEIKPLFDRNQLTKNSAIAGIRRTSIRPVPVVEETKPVEIVPKIELSTEIVPVSEEEVKKIIVEPVQSEPVKEQETVIAEDELKQLPADAPAPLTPSVELPVEQIKLLPAPESKPSLPADTLVTAANENQNEPAGSPLENNGSITKTVPELPMAPMSEAMPQELPADEPKEQMPMIETPASADSEMLKLSDSSSAASTDSKLTEEILALPEVNIPQEPVQKLASAEITAEASPAEETPMENLSSTKTEILENDQASLSSIVQESKPEMMQPELEMEAMPVQENLKKVPEQQTLETVQDQTNLQETPAQENLKTGQAEQTVEKVDTPLPTPESLPEQQLVLEDPIVKHVLDAAVDNKNIDEPSIVEPDQSEPIQEQQLKTEILSDEKLKTEPEMSVMAESALEQMANDEPLKDSKPMPSDELMMKEPEKSLPEMTPEINAAKPEIAMETVTENTELLKTENEEQVKIDLRADTVANEESIPEAVNNEEVLKSKTEEQMSIAEITPAEPELLKKDPATLSGLPLAQPETLNAQPEMANTELEMLNLESEMPSVQFEMLKSEPEALKPALESLPVEAEPVNVVLQESTSELQTPKLDSEPLNEKVSEQPMMQQDEPALLSENTEPEMPMQQAEPEMLKTEPELEMPKVQPVPEMMMNQEPEPAQEEPEMMKLKLKNEEQTITEEKIESVVPEQSLKTVPEISEEAVPAPVNVETPVLNSEEQKSEIVKAISDLVNEATQEADSQVSVQINPAEPVLKSEMSALPPALDITNENPEPQPLLDMDTLMSSPALLDNQLRSDIPLFIPVKVIMDNEPAPEIVSVPLPENTLKHHQEGHTENIVPVEVIDEASKQITKTAQSEPIIEENPVAEEMIVKNIETPAPEKEVTQVMLESDPVEMKDNQQDVSEGALKVEIFTVPEEEVKIVENLPNIEMGTPEKSEALRLNIPLPEPEQTDSERMPSLSQDTAAPTPDTRLFDAQPILQEIVDLASNLVKAETISASADETPIVLNVADETKETETQDSALFSKSAPTADGLSGAQMVDDHLSETAAKFSEPIEETPRQNDMVSEVLRIVSPEKIGELVERTELPESAANRIDLGRSLQKKLDPRKRRFLFKSSAYSR